MAMLDRDLSIQALATTIFLAQHICSRNPFEPDSDVSTEQASLLMQLYELALHLGVGWHGELLTDFL
jgi:hypothetical protein